MTQPTEISHEARECFQELSPEANVELPMFDRPLEILTKHFDKAKAPLVEELAALKLQIHAASKSRHGASGLCCGLREQLKEENTRLKESLASQTEEACPVCNYMRNYITPCKGCGLFSASNQTKDREINTLKESIRVKDEALFSLKSFLYTITLWLQRHSSHTESEKTAMFQTAYQLYCKHEVEKALSHNTGRKE